MNQLISNDSLKIMNNKNNSQYLMTKINRNIAKPFIEKYHYTSSIGKTTLSFGLYDTRVIQKQGLFEDIELVGVITYGQVSSKELAQSLFDGGTQYNTFELLRMAVKDDVNFPRSCFISKTIKYIKHKYPYIKCLVSFADKTEGHYGYVYQASNWLYLGTTGFKYHYEYNGKRINKRVAFDKAKYIKMTEKEYVHQNKWLKIIELPKFRYIYPIDKNIHIKQEVKQYPKQIKLDYLEARA